MLDVQLYYISIGWFSLNAIYLSDILANRDNPFWDVGQGREMLCERTILSTFHLHSTGCPVLIKQGEFLTKLLVSL